MPRMDCRLSSKQPSGILSLSGDLWLVQTCSAVASCHSVGGCGVWRKNQSMTCRTIGILSTSVSSQPFMTPLLAR